MADNPFDQFDPAPREATSASNPFDQFDSKQPTVSAPARLPGGLDEQGFPVPGGTGGHEPSPAPSRLERVGRELASPVLGAAQLAAHILPLPAYQDGKWTNAASATDATVAANEARIEEARGGAKGVNWERVGLDFVNPGNYAGAGLGLEGRGAAAAMGALGAVTQPVTGEGGYWTGKAGQAAAGAAAGRAGEAVARGVGAVIAPEMERGARALTDAGARLTPGQMVGGTGKRAEDALSSVPVVGTLIRSAQVTSLEDFNRAALNQGLEHIGVQVPQTVEAGRPALNYARDAIKAAYNDVVPRMVGQKDPTFVSEINNIRALG
jgi:hypothetical protein